MDVTSVGEEVAIEAVMPSPGYATEITDSGPNRVGVRFRSEDHRSEIEVWWDAGLQQRIDEK